MAGTRFIKQYFIDETAKRYAALIAEQQKIVDDEKMLTDAEKIRAWRARETDRVKEFAARLHRGEVTDHELANFDTNRVPDVGGVRYHSTESMAERQVVQLKRNLEKILVYVKSLAEVEPGIIEVSAADLKRIGYGL